MTEIVIAVIGSGALSALISGVFAVATGRKRSKNGVRRGVQLLLYAQIKSRAREYIARGSIYADELEDLLRDWNCYHNELDGNGFLDSLMAQVKTLPVAERSAAA